MNYEVGAATAVVGLAIANTLQLYKDTAPDLDQLRNASPHDYTMRQHLLDADLFGGITVLTIGGAASLLTMKITPLLLASSGLLLISLYYRSVLASASPTGGSTDEG